MEWLHDVIAIGIGGLLGILLGRWMEGRRKNDKLFTCYASYFDAVLSVAVEIDSVAAEEKFLDLSLTSRQIELLESDARCVMSTGLLFAQCSTLVAKLSGASPATAAEIALLRQQISAEYSAALRVVRKRLGSARELSWRTSDSQVGTP